MSYNFKKVKVLIVESSVPMFELLKSVMNAFSVPRENIHSAYSVDEGFDKFRKGGHDLLIIDWLENPDRGLQLTKRVRTDERSPNIFVPVIMTAGSGHMNRVIRARDAGVSEYLVKPFTSSQLAKKIERVIEQPRMFVVSEAFVGPDRRAKNPKPYDGSERRQDAVSAVPVAFATKQGKG